MKKILLFVLALLQFLSGQALERTGLFADVYVVTNLPVSPVIERNQAVATAGNPMNAGTTAGRTEITNDGDEDNVTYCGFPEQVSPDSSSYSGDITCIDNIKNGSGTTIASATGSQTVPSCTEIINPTDGDALVSVTANITWIREFFATGYLMTVYEGDPNGILIWNRVDVGNGTNAQPPEFKPRTRYYVTIIPYNDLGEAQGCRPITFTTGDGLPLPDCAVLTLPEPGSIDVPIDSNLAWEEVPGAESYILSVGTRPAGTDIVDNSDVGLSTTFELPNDLPLGTRVYVQIRTRQGLRESESCAPAFFDTFMPTTEELKNSIPTFFTPNDDGSNDFWSVGSFEDFTVEHIVIFDRYGKLLKQLAPDEGWDGTFNGRTLPSGSYWYSIRISNFPELKGYFFLKR